MADYVSAVAGDWETDTNWSPTGVPGDGDRVTNITHAMSITAGQTITVGAADTTAAIVVGTGGSVTVPDTANLDAKGHIDYNGGKIRKEGSGRVRLVNGVVGPYHHRISRANNQTGSFLEVVGTETDRSTIDYTGTAGSEVQTGGFTGGGRVNAEYADIDLQAMPSRPQNTSAWFYRLHNVVATVPGGIRQQSLMVSNERLSLVNLTIKGATGTALEIQSYGWNGSAVRLLSGAIVYQGTTALTPATGLTVTDDCIFGGNVTGASSGDPWTVFEDAIIVGAGNLLVNHYNLDNVYFLASGDNPHYHQPRNTNNVTVTDPIYELNGGNFNGDGYLVPEPTAARTYRSIRPIVLSGTGTGIAGTVMSLLGNPNARASVERGTFVTGSGAAGVVAGETYFGHPDMVEYVRDCIGISGNVNGQIVSDGGSLVDAAITMANFNSLWDYVGNQPCTSPYPPAAKFGTPPGANDRHVNANFVGDPFDCGMEAWDLSLGGPGTFANALAEMKLRNEPGFDPDYTPTALKAFIRAALTPTNGALSGTASDGGDFGAVAVAPGGANVPPPAPELTAPANGVTVDASTVVSWTQAADADADPITHYREHRVQGTTPWTRSAAVTTGHTWDTSGLSNAVYEWRIIANDGTDETPSSVRTLTVQHASPNLAPSAPAWVAPSNGSTHDTQVAITYSHGVDPEGQSVQTRGEWRVVGGSFAALFALQLGQSFNWSTAALAEADYEVRLYSDDGVNESAVSEVRTFTVAHAGTGTSAGSGLLINGIDPAIYGVAIDVESLAGAFGNTRIRLDEQFVGGQSGSVIVDAQIEPRDLTLATWILGDDAADVAAKYDNFASLVGAAQPVQLLFTHRPSRYWLGELVEIYMTPVGPAHISAAWRGPVVFRAATPSGIDVQESSVLGVVSSPVALQVGTAETFLRLRIAGPATNPVVTVRRWDGTVEVVMQFVGSLVNGEFYVVDNRPISEGGRTAYRNPSGTFGTGTSILGTDLPAPNFFALKRAWHRRHLSQFPTITCSSGTMEVFFYRRWL